ncbi:ThiF family adenylyltransferase [Streptodolium elevatio]|uniref:ThiF family adenylyltransferase n=1 Tax=Streptodolium elevatio TaxID=3157996 RepID=A0ABV3DQ53_9ACTN
MRPRLRPALVRMWRDQRTLQFGLDPARALLLTGLDPALARLLDRLDGTRTPDQLYESAGRLGVAAGRTRALLDVLAEADLLEDADAGTPRPGTRHGPGRHAPGPYAPGPHASGSQAPGRHAGRLARDRLAPDRASASLVRPGPDGGEGVLARRAAARVVVRGAGRVGAATATLLAAAGVGTVEVGDSRPFCPADAGAAAGSWDGVRKRRETAAREALRRVAPEVRLSAPPGRTRPDAVVLATEGLRPEPALLERLATACIPHLYADVRETTGIVGPFVDPGRSACGRCLDLYRRDRDPAWPRLAAQYSAPARRWEDRPCDGVLATAVAAQAALQLLIHLDGDTPTATGGTLEIALPDGAMRRRSWHPNAECGCGAFAVATHPRAAAS